MFVWLVFIWFIITRTEASLYVFEFIAVVRSFGVELVAAVSAVVFGVCCAVIVDGAFSVRNVLRIVVSKSFIWFTGIFVFEVFLGVRVFKGFIDSYLYVKSVLIVFIESFLEVVYCVIFFISADIRFVIVIVNSFVYLIRFCRF